MLGALIAVGAAASAQALPPTFSGASPFTAGQEPISVVAADLNADGRPDVVTGNFGTNGAGGNSVLLNTTAPGPARRPSRARAPSRPPTGRSR